MEIDGATLVIKVRRANKKIQNEPTKNAAHAREEPGGTPRRTVGVDPFSETRISDTLESEGRVSWMNK